MSMFLDFIRCTLPYSRSGQTKSFLPSDSLPFVIVSNEKGDGFVTVFLGAYAKLVEREPTMERFKRARRAIIKLIEMRSYDHHPGNARGVPPHLHGNMEAGTARQRD